MVDASHLGYTAGKRHPILSTEVLETYVGTGMSYLLDTTEYEEVNGQLRFLPKLIHGYEIPFADGISTGVKNGSYSAHTTPIPRYFKPRDHIRIPASVVLGTEGYTFPATMLGCGVVDIET